MSKTIENLEAAFAGESQASRKYHFFAIAAEQEGFPQVARLFRAASLAESIHAGNHLRAMDKIGKTSDNLKAAIEGENYEITTMYPEFIAEAESADEKKAVRTFKWAFEVEKGHEELYKQALATLGADGKDVAIYVCPVCGNTHIGVMTENCPICNTPGAKFIKVD